MNASREYGFLIGLLAGLGGAFPVLRWPVFALIAVHLAYGVLCFLRARLVFAATSAGAAVLGIWSAWGLGGLGSWEEVLLSPRLPTALAFIAAVLLLEWLQRRATPHYRRALNGRTLTDLLLYRWVPSSRAA